jgi:5-methylcytosine-specific restriction enzyme subunit McrC
MSRADVLTAFERGSLVARPVPGGDACQIEAGDYKALRETALEADGALPLKVRVDSRGERLVLGQFVGVVPLASGTILEVLPKCYSGADACLRSRRALLRLVARCGSLHLRVLTEAAQEKVPPPLHLAILSHFLSAVEALVRGGLASAYIGVEDRRRALRGKLSVAHQLRTPALLPDSFWTVAHEFVENRPENRLIRSALQVTACLALADLAARHTQLSTFFSGIPSSSDYWADFRAWSPDRLVTRYRALLSWCRLILGGIVAPVAGSSPVPALLFPMERLFESYVGSMLRESLPPTCKLIAQARNRHLVHKDGNSYFVMRPDFVIRRKASNVLIVDAKWKLPNAIGIVQGGTPEFAQEDLYQMLAYGRSYLGGLGSIVLAYPRTDSFKVALGPFLYESESDLKLSFIPVDIEDDPLELKAILGVRSQEFLPTARDC